MVKREIERERHTGQREALYVTPIEIDEETDLKAIETTRENTTFNKIER